MDKLQATVWQKDKEWIKRSAETETRKDGGETELVNVRCDEGVQMGKHALPCLRIIGA
jgi:hypothetical protein